MERMIDKGGTLINADTQELTRMPDCDVSQRDGKMVFGRHTHAPDRKSPHPEEDHPWGDLLQDRHYHHTHPHHPHRNCEPSPTDNSSGDAATAHGDNRAIETTFFHAEPGIEMPLPLDETIFI